MRVLDCPAQVNGLTMFNIKSNEALLELDLPDDLRTRLYSLLTFLAFFSL